MKTNQINQLKLNRFKSPVYDKKNLINFENRNIWMNGIESNKNPDIKGFGIFIIFCVIAAGYFIFR